MAVPDFQTLMLPILRHAGSGNEVVIKDLMGPLADEFKLAEEDRKEPLPSGTVTRFNNRVYWAKTYLQKARLVESVGRGRFRLTQRGRDVLASKPPRIDRAFLSQFDEFKEFRSAGREGDTEGETAEALVEATKTTPDEMLRLTHREIDKALRAEILDRMLAGSPAFFERAVVALLKAMGYGGFREGAEHVVGGTGDGDPLLFDVGKLHDEIVAGMRAWFLAVESSTVSGATHVSATYGSS